MKKYTPLEIIKGKMYGYFDPNYIWGRSGERGRGILWDESGYMRVAAIFGWIFGLWQSGQAVLANELACDLFDRLDFLANYGGVTTVDYCGSKMDFPRYMVKMADDGYPHSFSLLWYQFDRVMQFDEKLGEREIAVGNYPRLAYKFNFNGGMIFHGAGEVFAVRIGNDSNPWGIHT